MALQIHLFIYVITFISFIFSCYIGTFISIDILFIKEVKGCDNQAYANSYLRSIGKDGLDNICINVDDFGARGDGRDDTKAFEKAWREACLSAGIVNLVVPSKTYLVKPIKFSGPCSSSINMQIYGTIEASNDREDYSEDRRYWLRFDDADNLMVGGGGTINGNGKIWWENSCKINNSLPCKKAPTAISFLRSKNIILNNLKIENAQQMHVAFQKCINVRASNLIVSAPGDSPNTDGIHVTRSQNISISNCVIGTGDDCISIVHGSQNVQVMNIACGPGHGISIGSLGAGNSEAHVSDVLVNGVRLDQTTNGVRIKTWQGGLGSASNIRFENIEMNNVTNPILINQYYRDRRQPSYHLAYDKDSAVQVQNVVYKNIKGTSASKRKRKIAIKFDCSQNFPCQGIVLQNINLQESDREAKATAFCNNANFDEIGFVSPSCP